jgi:hypothetical protein
MTLAEIKQIQLSPQAPVQIVNAYEYDGYLVINDYIALKVCRVSNSYDDSTPIPITLNSIVYGYLVFTKCKGEIVIDQMNDFEFTSFLTFSDFANYTDSSFKFDTDYLLVKENFFIDYISDYEKTSMLWGGFAHSLNGGAPISRHKMIIPNIEIGDKLKDFNTYSYESCIRAIEQPYAFERFLKLYHLLELQFDYFIINKIQSLTIPADSNRIGKILNEYSHKEIDRLTEIIGHYCTNITKLEQLLSNISAFTTIAEDMFMNFGKSNGQYHLSDITKFRYAVSGSDFTSTYLYNGKVHSNTTIDHDKFIIGITSYWIYKIRCSIAHNKIGEYILSWNDENFIVEFGEPLLKEVLMQCFKK